jgi:hypothetical protein
VASYQPNDEHATRRFASLSAHDDPVESTRFFHFFPIWKIEPASQAIFTFSS